MTPDELRNIGLSVSELADQCGVSERTVEGWYQGRPINKPSQKLLKLLTKD